MRRIAFSGLALLIVFACTGDHDVPPPLTTTTVSSTTSTTETATDTTTTLSPTTTTIPLDIVTVTRVVDGDTLDISTGERVRLIGIDTPEVYGEVECYGPEASARAEALAEGRQATIETDDSQGLTDRYGRTLAYVWLGDVMLNEQLVAEGYAEEYLYRYSYRYRDRFVLAESRAQAAGLGLWGAC